MDSVFISYLPICVIDFIYVCFHSSRCLFIRVKEDSNPKVITSFVVLCNICRIIFPYKLHLKFSTVLLILESSRHTLIISAPFIHLFFTYVCIYLFISVVIHLKRHKIKRKYIFISYFLQFLPDLSPYKLERNTAKQKTKQNKTKQQFPL